MEDRNEKAQELDLEQMEKVSGGGRGNLTLHQWTTYTCEHCGATFTDDRKWLDHCRECDPNFKF